MIVSKDMRSQLSAIGSQGQRQSCLSFAASAAHEQFAGTGAPFSVEHLFYHAVQRMPGADPAAGTNFSATQTALAVDGQPCEAAWPYQLQQPDPCKWTPPVHAFPINRCGLQPVSADMATIVKHLDAGRPTVLGLIITDAFYRTGTDGRLPSSPSDPERAGHAVLAVGYGEISGLCSILIRNSWGIQWGMAGHAWLGQSYLEHQLVEAAITR